MDKLFQSAPEIIGQAAKSPLGIFALMILALSVLGFVFFRQSSERTRTAIFALMFIGVAAFGYATFRTASATPSAVSNGIPSNQSLPSREPETHGFSTDRDHPTALQTNEIHGTGIDRKRVRYYFSFIGGPGEVTLTFDFTSGGLAQGATATIFDHDFVRVAEVTSILNRGDSERKVAHFQLSDQQPLIIELDLEGNETQSAGSFLLRVDGAVRFTNAHPAQ